MSKDMATFSRRRVRCISCLVLLTMIGSTVAFTTGTKDTASPLPPTVQPWEEALQNVKSKTSPEVQEAAVVALAARLLEDRAAEFSFSVDPSIGPEGKDTFQVVSPGTNASVVIKGTSGVAAAWGLLHYLKYYCNAHVSWEADQLALPKPLPPANINITSNDRFRYYQNVCTVSYSMAWWDFERWEREIDWMALNGINIPLAFTGQEGIWQRVYTKLGITQEELDQHFAGPAFLAWGRMGNIRGWGGPLPQSWHDKTLALQHQILERMRQFGMMPILPAFAGHVPAGLARVFPSANITRLGTWNYFNATYSCSYLLDPSDPLFKQIGSDFIEELTKEFGTDHLYNCDTFNEMTPRSSDTEYLKSVGASIFAGMTSSDPTAVWVMQGWLFLNTRFWKTPQAKALLTSVPIGRMLLLDLATESSPQYSRLESYFGQPFIACMLHDFGGVDGFFGKVDAVLTNIFAVRKFPNVTVVGTGLTPEGINQNYVMYDLMNELAWRTQPPNMTSWAAAYASRRYNSSDPRLAKVWQLLMGSVYVHESGGNHGNIILTKRPDVTRKTDSIWYTVDDVVMAWDLMKEVIDDDLLLEKEGNAGRELEDRDEDDKDESLEESDEEGEEDGKQSTYPEEDKVSLQSSGESKEEEQEEQEEQERKEYRVHARSGVIHQLTFLHDVVDLSRQMLQILFGQLVLKMVDSYNSGNVTEVKNIYGNISLLLTDLDQILATSPDFLLGAWTEGAASWATNEKERQLYVFNALNQVTTWGPDGNILDYAAKQWSGAIEHYVRPRWEVFFEFLIDSLMKGTTFDQGGFSKQVFEQVEDPFSKNVNASYPAEPRGDTIVLAQELYAHYRHFFNSTISTSKEKKTRDPLLTPERHCPLHAAHKMNLNGKTKQMQTGKRNVNDLQVGKYKEALEELENIIEREKREK